MSVEVVHWNPRKPRVSGPLGRLLPKRPPVNNFGDLLGPRIVREVLSRRVVDASPGVEGRRLLAVGSILRLARAGDVVWGAGVNGKSIDAPHELTALDVRAVRGPLTARFLAERGVAVPDVYGDPGLLVGSLWPRESLRWGGPPVGVTLIPNLNDADRYRGHPNFWHPCSPLDDTLSRIANSEFVIGSSLHAIVLAESFGIPARLIRSAHEPSFKYDDYYLGSGRDTPIMADDVDEALTMGGEPALQWDPGALLDAFPVDLWMP
jgi:pyruvyltransferase